MTTHTAESGLKDLSVHELHDLALDRAIELADLRFFLGSAPRYPRYGRGQQG